jgi:translation initiation factor IF-3
MSTLGIADDAMACAEEADVDLVEIAPTADPPVCRPDGLRQVQVPGAEEGRTRPSASRRSSRSRKSSSGPAPTKATTTIKMRNLRRFIAEDGDKGKVTLRFRGREIAHQEFGMRHAGAHAATTWPMWPSVEHMPKLEGRQMIMVLAPKRKSVAPVEREPSGSRTGCWSRGRSRPARSRLRGTRARKRHRANSGAQA